MARAVASGGALSGLAGCTAPGNEALREGGGGREEEGRGGAGPVTLTVLTHYANEPLKSALQGAVDAWNAGAGMGVGVGPGAGGARADADADAETARRRIQVRTTAVAFPDLLTTYMVRQAAGQEPDILHPYCLWTGQLVRAGVLRPAPPEVARQIRRNYSAAAVAGASVDGTLYGYPTEVQTYCLYYNKRLLHAAGIAGPPRTCEELEDAAYRTARRDRHGNTLVQGFGLSRSDDSTVVGQTLALLAARGGRFLTPDGRRTALGSPAGRAVLDLEHRLIERGAADPGVSLFKAFPAGQVAMAINAGWWTASLRNVMGASYREVGVAPVPGRTADDRGTLATGFLMGVNARSKHPQEAWEFLRWLNAAKVPANGSKAGGAVGKPVHGAGRSWQGRSLVTRMSALQVSVGSMTGRADDMRTLLLELAGATSVDPNLRPFLDALHYAAAEPNGPRAQQAKTLLRKNIEEVWTGRTPVDAALRTLSRQVDQELSRPY
ncbi:extracellular solute-binding protein [Streptomyces bugieae]|uniref:Extracellular solute-binding protein n=1 Tax=Streptomyces bugieae TaxID=3098223 RepID=A0ABU7NUI3_9ACTN|nr:extracellular solute-binding protein [Streptomyces sp. DSM 41528]